MRGVVAAEQVLARRAGGDQPHAQVGQLDQRERLDERVERALEAAGGGERDGQRHEQGEPARGINRRRGEGRGRAGGSASSPGREQAQRGLEPARGDRRRAGGGLVAGLLEHGRGGLVADARRALDVVRARRERARAVGQRGRGARVRLQPPRLAGAVVDGAAHERVAEAVAARRRRSARRRSRPAGRRSPPAPPARSGRRRRAARSRSNGSPATAAPQPSRCARSLQPADLLPERGRDGGRHADRIAVLGLMAGRAARARARAPRGRTGCRRSASTGAAGGAPSSASASASAERTERDLGHEPVAAGLLERGEQAVRHLAGAERERDQDRAPAAGGAAGGRSARARRRPPSGRRRA